MEINKFCAVALFCLIIFPQISAEDSVIPGLTDLTGQRSMVLINSNKWQDAYLASIYGNIENLPLRYIQDPFQTGNFMQELTTNKLQKVYLFSSKTSVVPSLTYRLHSQNLDVRETVYEDHFDLSAKMLGLIPSSKVIIVRDDFAFDALSAKYLSYKLKAPVIFSKGPEDMDERVMNALLAVLPSEIYLVGRPEPKLEEKLSQFKLIKLQGRDEFDTNNIVNRHLQGPVEYNQGLITTGDILELAIMNIKNQPVFLVPDYGAYSMPGTAAIIEDSGLKHLLGIGRLISEPASWLKQRTGAKILIKFATVRTKPQDEGMVQNDININLEGYGLPSPRYDGKITEIVPAYGEPLSSSTGALISSNRPVAPLVEFRSYFENTGNIEFPAYVILDIKTQSGETVANLQSERQMVYPKRQNVFKVEWGNAPAEGKYIVEAKVFGDVYDGINLPGKSADFDLSWLIVLINLLLLLLALLMLAAAIYSSYVLNRDLRAFSHLYKKSMEHFDSLHRYVTGMYHFRGGERKQK